MARSFRYHSTALPGAIVEMVDGPFAGQRRVQTADACSALGETDQYALICDGLANGERVQLRGSISGYATVTVPAMATGSRSGVHGRQQCHHHAQPET